VIPRAAVVCAVVDCTTTTLTPGSVYCNDCNGLTAPPVHGEPDDTCLELERELSAFLDDPITSFYGVGSEMSPLLIERHVARHGCRGLGQA
jgi:hypothetical protein